MQNHRIAFTRAFITSAFTVPDDEDLVCMSLVWPSPDAVAVLRNRCLAQREFIPATHIYCMYTEKVHISLILNYVKFGIGLCTSTASRQQEKSSYVIFLMPFHILHHERKNFMGVQTCIPGTKPQKGESTQPIMTLPS